MRSNIPVWRLLPAKFTMCAYTYLGNPSPAWQVQFTRSEEIGIVIITMQHRLGIKRNALYSTEVQHPFLLVRATLVHFYFYACFCPSFRSPVLFCIVLKKGTEQKGTQGFVYVRESNPRRNNIAYVRKGYVLKCDWQTDKQTIKRCWSFLG